MAHITRTNGSIFSGVLTNTDLGALVSVAGAQPKAFGILLKDGAAAATNIDAAGGADDTIDAVFRLLATRGIIAYYQVETATPWQVSVLVERTDWTAATLQAAIRALGTAVGTSAKDVSGAVVTDVGLKLALS